MSDMYVQRFRIRNFRSLADVTLRDLPPLFVLFGHNGSGKSNILAALETIFSPKIEPGYQPGAPQTSAPFFRGLVADFHHNYYRNIPSQASFEVSLRTSRQELAQLWPQGFTEDPPTVPKGVRGGRFRISLVGHFDPEPELPGAASMVLESAQLNSVSIYDHGAMPEPWLPQELGLSLERREDIGGALLDRLTGMFSTIGIARFLGRESFGSTQDQTYGIQEETDEARLAPREAPTSAAFPSSFKRRLFNLKQSQLQADQDKFRGIREIFRQVAGWGEIDFAQAGPDAEFLEVMTWDKASLWLPVTRRGAGAEQLLVMISEALIRGAMIVGIEELESNLDDDNKGNLFELLQSLVTTMESGVSQVMATAHSSFYASELQPHQKRFVLLDDEGRTVVKPWSEDTYAQLFRPRLSSTP